MQTILILEDQPSTILLLKILLNKKDVKLCIASDADEFYECINKQEYDTMLLDIGIPGEKNGLDLMEEYREKGGKAKIIVCSAYTLRHDEAIERGADDFCAKPFSDNTLYKKLGLDES